MIRQRAVIASVAAVLVAGSCSSTAASKTGGSSGGSSKASSATSSPAITSRTSTRVQAASPAAPMPLARAVGRVVVVIMENHSYSDIIGSAQAPYLNSLARHGLSLTQMHAVTHPSQPNYIALFSGSTHGVTGDACPQTIRSANLGSELRRAHLSFTGYSEGLPRAGSKTCNAGSYARRHVPWTDFTDLPSTVNQSMRAFPTNYARLPAVSFVVPNVDDDMHDGTIRQGDTWVYRHLAGYARWASAHGSLLVVTWDEDDRSEGNRIPTIITGAGIKAKRLGTYFTLYSLLRTLEDRYRLHRLGASATARAIPLR